VQYYTSQLVGRARAFMSASDGRATDAARGGRANLVVNYRFNAERWKGLSVGGAARWRAALTIGYGVKPGPGGNMVLDIDQGYRGKAETYLDFLTADRGRMKPLGGFNYRVQLNVRNLLNENDPVPMTALSTGAVTRVATVDSRLIQMTFAGDF